MALKVVTYNIWFEEKELLERVQHIVGLLFSLEADIICLQEVTQYTFTILESLLGPLYHFSRCSLEQNYDTLILSKVPILNAKTINFSSSKMGRNLHFIELMIPSGETSSTEPRPPDESRELSILCEDESRELSILCEDESRELSILCEDESRELSILCEDESQPKPEPDNNLIPVIVATTHLESIFKPPHNQVKIEQLKQSFQYLSQTFPDHQLILTGDTNLGVQDQVTLPEHWHDAWTISGSPSDCQFTYDGTQNVNVKGRFRSRLDRIFVKGSTFSVNDFCLVGQEKIEGLGIQPSDHFGIKLIMGESASPP